MVSSTKFSRNGRVPIFFCGIWSGLTATGTIAIWSGTWSICNGPAISATRKPARFNSGSAELDRDKPANKKLTLYTSALVLGWGGRSPSRPSPAASNPELQNPAFLDVPSPVCKSIPRQIGRHQRRGVAVILDDQNRSGQFSRVHTCSDSWCSGLTMKSCCNYINFPLEGERGRAV